MSLYGESKLATYRQLAALAESRGLTFAWGRIFLPYGPYQARARLIPSVIIALLQQRPIPCPAGDQMRDFIHVQDVADAFVALLDSELTGARNIGSGLPVSARDLVTLIARLMVGERSLHFDASPQRGGEPASIVADTRRLRSELGWRPRLTLEDGLARTIAWWRSNLRARGLTSWIAAPPRRAMAVTPQHFRHTIIHGERQSCRREPSNRVAHGAGMLAATRDVTTAGGCH